MSYYCKKCGAVVVGKFCSCCGQEVKTAFEEFISAKNRQRRAFRHWAEQKDFNRYGCIPLQVASLAESIAEKRNASEKAVIGALWFLSMMKCEKSTSS